MFINPLKTMFTNTSAFFFFILFFVIIILGLVEAPVFYDPDSAWHLATGDLIRAKGMIPAQDDWSFTTAHEVWYNLSWGFDVLVSWLFSIGGFSAVYTLTVVVFALSIALMMDNAVKRGASVISILLLIIPVILVEYNCTLARPNMCSILLSVFFYIALARFRETGKTSSLILLPVLMIAWVNLHGGFLLVFPLLGFFIWESFVPLIPYFKAKFSKAGKYYTNKAECWQLHRRFVYLLLTLLGCLLASLVNPYGFAVYYGAYKSIAAPFSTYLVEWKAVEIGHNPSATILLFILLFFTHFWDKRIALADRLIGVFITLLSLSSLRHTGVAALLLIPYLALRITHVLHAGKSGEKWLQKHVVIMQDMQKKDVRVLSFIMVIVSIAVVYLPMVRDTIVKEPIEPLGFQSKKFPVKEAEFIEKNYPNLRFFNHYNIGGYLVYLWRGRVKVFVDGRANSLYSDELLGDYLEVSENHAFGNIAASIIAQYRIQGLIIPNDDKDFWVWNGNPAWRAVYRGEVATVFLKK